MDGSLNYKHDTSQGQDILYSRCGSMQFSFGSLSALKLHSGYNKSRPNVQNLNNKMTDPTARQVHTRRRNDKLIPDSDKMDDNSLSPETFEIEAEKLLEEIGKIEDVNELTESHIYFDFVPPALNAYDYIAKELSELGEMVMQLHVTDSAFTPPKKYFTFLHTKKLTTKQASLSLFDAIPECFNKEDEENSGIGKVVICLLDKTMTFEYLREISLAQNSHVKALAMKAKKNHIRFAVQSPELLSNTDLLLRRLTILLEENVKHYQIIDITKESEAIFDGFYQEMNAALQTFENKLGKLKHTNRNKFPLKLIRREFRKLKELYYAEKKDNGLELTDEIRQCMSGCKQDGVIGYTLRNNSLLVYVFCPKNIANIKNTLKQLKFKYKLIPVKESQLCNAFSNIKSGSKLHPFYNNYVRHGTIGMICSVTDALGQSSTRACISGAHVIQQNRIAYTSFDRNRMVNIGKCIYSPPPPPDSVNLKDISVIELSTNNIEYILNENVIIFKDDRTKLNLRKVFKFGATTGKTTGRLINASFVLEFGKYPTDVLLFEHDNKKAKFADAGDSGAIVLSRFGEKLEAIALIFGGLTIPSVQRRIREEADNSSISSSDTSDYSEESSPEEAIAPLQERVHSVGVHFLDAVTEFENTSNRKIVLGKI